MNRKQRRAQAKNRAVAKCKACDSDHCEIHVLTRRAIYADDPTAPKDLGICATCPCSTGLCDSCGETAGHWLGCPRVGLPEMPATGATIQ